MPHDTLTWTAEEWAGLRDVLATLESHPELTFIREQTGGQPGSLLTDHFRQGLQSGDLTPFLDTAADDAAALLRDGVPFAEIVEHLRQITGPLYNSLGAAYADELPRVLRGVRAFAKLKDALLLRAAEVLALHQVTRAEEEQRKIIRELSTPTIPVWDEILVMPLVGVVDSVRAKQMMEQLLERITQQGARVVILDVTGVPAVDTAVADHFLRVTKAARLVGARSILVGISPLVAQALVRLGVSLEGIETHATLRAGLEHAFAQLGYRIVRDPV